MDPASQSSFGTKPVGVISPHYDDAVLSASSVLTADSLVITVFSGQLGARERVTGWDRECGFVPGDDVAAIREREEDDALAWFGATGRALHLPTMLDRRSSAPLRLRTSEQVFNRLPGVLALHGRERRGADQELIAQVADLLYAELTHTPIRTWIGPLGVSHFDHQLTAAAILELAPQFPEIQWFLYEDLPYSFQFPKDVEEARRRVGQAGFELGTSQPGTVVNTTRKLASLRCYRSQMSGMNAMMTQAAATPERMQPLLRR